MHVSKYHNVTRTYAYRNNRTIAMLPRLPCLGPGCGTNLCFTNPCRKHGPPSYQTEGVQAL